MLISRFRKNRRGSVAPTFALAFIPVFGLAGAAVDYSRASSVRTSMQAALDATALSMAKLAPSLTQSQLQAQTTAYFNTNYSNLQGRNISVTPTYTTGSGSQLVITATAKVDMALMQILGFSTLDVAASSTIKWGNMRLRVALVLDNTGSMSSSNKMVALKTATNNLITQLKDAATTNGDVYISIIPFVKDVNVGSSNYNASWIEWSEWDSNNGSCSKDYAERLYA